MSLPVIFIHKTDAEHLKYAFNQAQKNDNHVIVIGDETNSHYSGIHHYPINLYETDSNKFDSLYEHLSTNGHFVELMCFKRWFILKDFMVGNNIDKCLYLDSDVMLYSSAEQEWNKFKNFEFTMSHRCCGSNAFFTLHGLKNLCKFIMDIYTQKESYLFDKIKSHYLVRQKHGLPGGVCDMTLMELYGYVNCGNVGEMMFITEDGSTYDHNINDSDQGYVMEKGMKKIIMDNGIPYGILNQDRVRFNTLHFQGPAKREMVNYAT